MKSNRRKLTEKQRQAAKPMPVFKQELRMAVKDGTKTVTRRLNGLEEINRKPAKWNYHGISLEGNHIFTDWQTKGPLHERVQILKCPYGKEGDICYLREPLICGPCPIAYYRDDMKPIFANTVFGRVKINWDWKRSILPQIHMPKEHARYFVRIQSITCERVQSITELDALAEQTHKLLKETLNMKLPKRKQFRIVWRNINGSASWDKNHWVWVIRFKLV